LVFLEETPGEHSNHKEPATEIHEMQNKILVQHRHDIEGEIGIMHDPGPNADRDHVREDVFDIDPQQREEGQKEMAEDNHQPDIPPGAVLAHNVPERFLRHVAVPDDEILGEGHVGVKDREGEKQGTDEIILMLVQDVTEHTLAVENHRNDVGSAKGHPDTAG